MNDLDKQALKIKELESDIGRLRFRVSKLEEYIEANMDPPPMRVEVVPSSIVGVAAEMGATIAEARNITRSSKESARSLRRVVSPQDDTGTHKTVESDDKTSK